MYIHMNIVSRVLAGGVTVAHDAIINNGSHSGASSDSLNNDPSGGSAGIRGG